MNRQHFRLRSFAPLYLLSQFPLGLDDDDDDDDDDDHDHDGDDVFIFMVEI